VGSFPSHPFLIPSHPSSFSFPSPPRTLTNYGYSWIGSPVMIHHRPPRSITARQLNTDGPKTICASRRSLHRTSVPSFIRLCRPRTAAGREREGKGKHGSSSNSGIVPVARRRLYICTRAARQRPSKVGIAATPARRATRPWGCVRTVCEGSECVSDLSITHGAARHHPSIQPGQRHHPHPTRPKAPPIRLTMYVPRAGCSVSFFLCFFGSPSTPPSPSSRSPTVSSIPSSQREGELSGLP